LVRFFVFGFGELPGFRFFAFGFRFGSNSFSLFSTARAPFLNAGFGNAGRLKCWTGWLGGSDRRWVVGGVIYVMMMACPAFAREPFQPYGIWHLLSGIFEFWRAFGAWVFWPRIDTN
jgi:hypothetical protein